MQKKSEIVITLIILLSLLLVVYIGYSVFTDQNVVENTSNESREILSVLELPQPEISSNISVDQAIQNRRSVRRFSATPLNIKHVSQLLWAAQGITDPERNFRTTPSAGHVSPLEVYLVVGDNCVQELEPGIYHYNPFNHSLEYIMRGDKRHDLSQAAHQQKWVNNAPISLVVTGNYEKMLDKYPDESLSTRFVDMEAGHAGQNIYLEVESLGLGTVAIGSFYDEQMKSLFKLPANETPLYIYPIGYQA